MRMNPRETGTLGPERVREAAQRLELYRQGKQKLDARLCDEAQWWQARHGAGSREGDSRRCARPVSAWLFNSVCSKHADLCDRIPVCTALPREAGDEADAAMLSKILPVICERCRFPQLYADNAWN